MKTKAILTLVALVACLTATAQIKTTPEGEQLKNMEYRSKGMVPDYTTMQISRFDQKDVVAHVVRNGNKFYIQDPISHYKVGMWMEGELSADGTQVVFHTPQAFTQEQGDNYYLYRLEQQGTTLKLNAANTDLVFSYADGALTQTDGGYLSITNLEGRTTSYAEYDISIVPKAESVLLPPADAQHQSYKMAYESQGSPMSKTVEVAFSGSDVFIASPTGAADSWIHGTLEGNKLVCPNNQFLGADESLGYFAYLKAAQGTIEIVTIPGFGDFPVNNIKLVDTDAIEFTWNAADRSFSTTQLFLVNPGNDQLGEQFYDYDKASFTTYDEVAATPADPTIISWTGLIEGFGFGLFAIDMPNLDVNGNFINQDNMYYNVYLDDKILQSPAGDFDIPYNYTDGQFIQVSGTMHTFMSYNDITDRIGVQVFYKVGDQLNHSALVWYDLKQAAVASAEAPKTVRRVDCFDAQGRRVAPGTKGLVVRQTTYSDGTKQTVKQIVK